MNNQIIFAVLRFPVLTIVLPLIIAAIGYLIYKWATQGILTLDLLKVMYGFLLLFLIASLAIVAFVVPMEPKNSEEITQILTMLSVLAGSFAQWAFSSKGESPKPGDKQ